ncbi:MAG: NCS2 family permease [Spirochaetes bacterium]|nr:NCS2 family permease [Spirochaetota bacterium]
MDKFFELSKRGSNLKTEFLAGFTTFMTMAYILAVNPGMLSSTGMDFGGVFTATALAAVIGTVAMALLGRLPFALAPGMGLNAIFAFVVCGAMGYNWRFALTAVFVEGIIFIILTAFNVREAIVDSIPNNLKKAIAVGIGLFIAAIGLGESGLIRGQVAQNIVEVKTKTIEVPKTVYDEQQGQLVEKMVPLTIPEKTFNKYPDFGLPYKLDLSNPEVDGVMVEFDEKGMLSLPTQKLGRINSPYVMVFLIGLLIGAILLTLKVKGALLIAIFASVLIGIPFGVTTIPQGFIPVSLPRSLAPVFMKLQFDKILTIDFVVVVFTFLFVDMFDTIGTLIGVTTKANILDENGKVPNIKGALFADAIGTTAGAMLGTSTVTTYIESAAGVEEGGKTGITALVTAGFFIIALFFAPLFGLVSTVCTAPALVLVGVFMMSPIKDLDFSDMSELVPAFLCMFIMPMAWHVSDGIAFGVLSYVIIKLGSGKVKDLHPVTLIIAAFFVVYFVAKVFM